jgi:hypothetical protein
MMLRRALAVALVAGCATGDARPPPPSPAPRISMSQPGYPNVHIRLRIAQRAPSVPPRDSELEIWLSGTRFHVRDLTGQSLHDLLGDITAPRQLGVPARTIEDLMDRDAEARHRDPTAPPTDLFGDLSSDIGWIYPSIGEPRELGARTLAPVAEQVLARDKASGLARAASSTRLGRACVEYRGVVTVSEDGDSYDNEVTRVIATPYLIFEAIQDAASPARSYVREIVVLEEGAVTEEELRLPGPPR